MAVPDTCTNTMLEINTSFNALYKDGRLNRIFVGDERTILFTLSPVALSNLSQIDLHSKLCFHFHCHAQK